MKDTLPRPQWQTHIGFISAAVGSAIGLGNVWRFPYLCYKDGGGAFLIPYFVALLLVGVPLMILELGLGHKLKSSAPVSFASVSRYWEWLGWWQVIFVTFGIVLYYSVVIAWCLDFFFFSFNLSWGSDPNTFFFKKFLSISKGPFEIGNVRSPVLVSLVLIWFLNWLTVVLGVERGLEKANKVFMPLLFFITFVLVMWSIGLPGAKGGLSVYLKPDFSRLKDVKVWMDAFSQIFFTLSLCFGIMIAYASYLPKKAKIVRDSVTIGFTNCFFSIFAGLGVFSVLGYMAQATGKPLNEVVTQSIGLAFVAYPKAISLLPVFSKLFGILFFASLVIAGLSSSISILEAFTSSVIDKFHYPRKAVVSVVCIVCFFGSLIFATQGGLFWLDIVDHFITNYGLVLAGILECLLIGWFYKASLLREHINTAGIWRLPSIWDYSIKFITPFVLIIIFISTLLKEFAAPYGDYSPLAVVVIGRDWLILTMILAFVFASCHRHKNSQ